MREAPCAAARNRHCGRVGALARLFLVGLAAFFVAACGATLAERNVVPEALVSKAEIEGMTAIRTWGDAARSTSHNFITSEAPRLRAKYRERISLGEAVVSNLLALSGGADDGAFGAGLLVGWGETGTRPEFDLVTGVSAGALIAPFAFLGKEYDRQLSEIFTLYSGSNIYQADILAGILGGPGLASNDPLKHLIEKYVDEPLMRRLAEERAKGRVLLIGTTNIDIQRPVYWDAGRIAQSAGEAGSRRSIELLRSVLLASAAIPGVFPPVRIKVKANGKEFEELHVDGGATREVFFSPADFSFRDLDKAVGRRVTRKLYVIRNGKLGPEWEATQETALALGARSLLTILKNQTIGDLIRMHAKAKAEGIDYNLAYIPDDVKIPRPAPFDQKYMQALYAEGLKMGRSGVTWQKAPPGLLEDRPVQAAR